MVRSSTSCLASIRRAARSSHSRARHRRISSTTLCGGVSSACRNAGGSGFSTVVTTKRLSLSGFIPSFWQSKRSQKLLTKDIWEDRYEDIRNIEHYLTRNGVVIRKFFLHVSADEQKKRFLERLDNPAKNC